MRWNVFFRWFDLWVGAYVDVPNRTLYVCPVPMFGVRIRWGLTIGDAIDEARAKGLMPALDVYECEACSAKPGAPTLCPDCIERRSKAGRAWRGPRATPPISTAKNGGNG